MLPTAIIAFREFLEALLIVGAFFGISRQLNLRREFEILLAGATGVALSFALAIAAFYFSTSIRAYLTESNAEIFEGYLMLISAGFIAYVVFALHKTLSGANRALTEDAKTKLRNSAFDEILFITIVTLILREGFEIALFTSSVSLFADFLQNLGGLFVGFIAASVAGAAVYAGFTKLPVKWIFKVSKYGILILGAYMVQGGVSEILEHQFNLELGLWGVVVRIIAAAAYAAAVWQFFLKKGKETT